MLDCAAGVVEFYDEGSAALTHLMDAYAFAAADGDALRMGFAAIYWTNYLQYQSRLADAVALFRRLSAEVLAAGDPVVSTFLAGVGRRRPAVAGGLGRVPTPAPTGAWPRVG